MEMINMRDRPRDMHINGVKMTSTLWSQVIYSLENQEYV